MSVTERMPVTINVYTTFGPYLYGSTLVVSVNFAQQLVQQYGQGLDIRGIVPGTFWFQDGAVLSVYPARPQPIPPPVPPPMPSGTLNVRFLTTIQDPVTGQVYDAGPLYRFTVDGLRRLNSRVGGLVFSTDRNGNNTFPASQLDNYVGRSIFVDQAVFAFRQPTSMMQ
jgi:hypothetical protein